MHATVIYSAGNIKIPNFWDRFCNDYYIFELSCIAAIKLWLCHSLVRSVQYWA